MPSVSLFLKNVHHESQYLVCDRIFAGYEIKGSLDSLHIKLNDRIMKLKIGELGEKTMKLDRTFEGDTLQIALSKIRKVKW